MNKKQRQAVVIETSTWLQTPYHSGARIKGVGVDCGQLLIGVFENAGVIPAGSCDPGQYSPEWHLHRSEEMYLGWVEKYCKPVDVAQPGDIAVFQFGRCVSHAGIVIDWPRIIHAYIGRGVIISDINEALLLDKAGQSRLRGLYRPKPKR
jgi:cell wall-associated NlpC family hydrolase